MEVPGPGGGGFEQLLGDLLNLMGGSSPGRGRIELARTLAQGAATGGQVEANVDPAERMRFEELARVAELHVGELTGLSVTPTRAAVEVVATGPGGWAWHTVDDWKFLFDATPETAVGDVGRILPGSDVGSGGVSSDQPGLGLVDLGPADLAPGAGGGGPSELLARWMTTMAPMLAALQLGSAIGHLARVTLGQYELPVPRPSPTTLLVVPANVGAFARDWSLPVDEVRLWVCLRDITSHAVITRPHVAARLRALLTDVVAGVTADALSAAKLFQGLDPTDPDSWQRILGNPEALAGGEPTPERGRAVQELMTVTAAWLGYVEHVVDRAGARLLGGRTALAEAWRRRQVDREEATRTAELLLGLDVGPAQVDRGSSFVRGVVDRAGDEGLNRLWSSPRTLPTPAELDAPGLWLERISMPEDPPSD